MKLRIRNVKLFIIFLLSLIGINSYSDECESNLDTIGLIVDVRDAGIPEEEVILKYMDLGMDYDDAKFRTAVPYSADMHDKPKEEIIKAYLQRCRDVLEALRTPPRSLTENECKGLYESHLLAKNLIDRGISEREVEEFLNNKYANHETLQHIGEIAARRAARPHNRKHSPENFAKKHSCSQN